jgi:hypothetical protein
MEKIDYRPHGDYLLPELSIEEDQPSYGKYGMLRKTYLKNHNPGLYCSLLLFGWLNAHLAEIDGRARTMLEALVHDYLQTHPASDKAAKQMEWVGYMNNL